MCIPAIRAAPWPAHSFGSGQLGELLGGAGEVVVAAGAAVGVVGHGVQADVQQIGPQAVVEARRQAAGLCPVTFQLGGDVDVLPLREPGPPEDQLPPPQAARMRATAVAAVMAAYLRVLRILVIS